MPDISQAGSIGWASNPGGLLLVLNPEAVPPLWRLLHRKKNQTKKTKTKTNPTPECTMGSAPGSQGNDGSIYENYWCRALDGTEIARAVAK